MGWLQDIAGKTSLKGQMVVTRSDGASTTYVNAEKAEEACGDLKGKLRFFRGAFFETGTSRPERKEIKEAATGPAPPRRRAPRPSEE